jgi:hypothetical protein
LKDSSEAQSKGSRRDRSALRLVARRETRNAPILTDSNSPQQ